VERISFARDRGIAYKQRFGDLDFIGEYGAGFKMK
jgi:hypothetical protein